MSSRQRVSRQIAAALIQAVVLALSGAASAALNLGLGQFVRAGGSDIVVPGYSVPSLDYWNDDDLKDLIVGEGGGASWQKVRIYLNVGTADSPQFGGWFYAQSEGQDLIFTGPGCPSCLRGACMGLFPRVVYWDADALKDLLVGQPDGTIKVFTNVGTEAEPTFGAGVVVEVGPAGAKEYISVSGRATPNVVDWNNDGRKDLLVGGLAGNLHLFINEGADTEPDFLTEVLVQDGGGDLQVPGERSSPHVFDENGDGRKDILTGNTPGQLLLYRNVGTDVAPAFCGCVPVCADGVPIDLPDDPRSRPFVCDWTGDGLADVLVGSGDRKVRLYEGVPYPGDANADVIVDGADYTAWADHYGSQPVPPCSAGGWAVGNFNEDDVVDGSDYTTWADHYLPASGAAAEPSSAALVGLGLLALIRRREG